MISMGTVTSFLSSGQLLSSAIIVYQKEMALYFSVSILIIDWSRVSRSNSAGAR